jgi:tRNA (cmo5U34)-methyltransferase
MLERSIPDYRSMRALVYKIGKQHIQPETLVVDVGCSTGLAVEPFVREYDGGCSFLLIDNAPAMVDACRERFREYDNVEVQQGDLWKYLPLKEPTSLVLSVLSLQFMPTAYRQRMINQIYDAMVPGGALILVEKIIGDNLDDDLVELYYQMKAENGYSAEQIAEKRRSLENVLSPLKAAWNVDLLRTAGFEAVEEFWRCLNFCGWIAVK